MVAEKPYFEEITSQDERIRIFIPTSKIYELKWHWDERDREITVIEDGGWQFQRENSLPQKLATGEKIFISAGEWHRVILGKNSLKVKIKEK